MSAVLIVVALVAVLAAPATSGATKYIDHVVAGSTSPGTTGGLLNQPVGVAVNRTGAGNAGVGDVFVVDAGNHRIQQFAANGSFVRAWGADVSMPAGGTTMETCTVPADCKTGITTTQVGGAFNAPQNVAVDQVTGAIYVGDQGNRRVQKFTLPAIASDPVVFDRAWGWDVTTGGVTTFEVCTVEASCKIAAAAGANGGQFNTSLGGVAVVPAGNPNAGNVLIGDRLNRRAQEFEADGDFVRAFGWDVAPTGQLGDLGTNSFEICSSSATGACKAGANSSPTNQTGAFLVNQPQYLAVDGDGILYTSDGLGGSHRVQRFDLKQSAPASLLMPELRPDTVTGTAAVPTSGLSIDNAGHLLVSRNAAVGVLELATPGGSASHADTHFANSGLSFAGIATAPVSGDIYLTSSTGGHRLFVADDTPPVPVVAIGGVADIGATTATLTGTIDSTVGGLPTDYRFQVSRDGVVWETLSSGTVPAGASEAISGTATGLLPNTAYRVRVLANRSFGNPDLSSAESTFVTDAIPPTIISTSAEAITTTSARVIAFVNPNSTPTTYRFEWGTETGNYTHRVPMPNAPVGAGPNAVLVAQVVDGLSPSTTYYFRLVAVSSATGTVAGPERTLTTRADGLPPRVPEMVSPNDNGAAGFFGAFAGVPEPLFQVAADGSRTFYAVAYGTDDATAGGNTRLLGSRSPTHWASVQMTPAVTEIRDGAPNGAEGEWYGRYQFVSPGLSCGVLTSLQRLTPDTPPQEVDNGEANLYSRDADGDYKLLAPEPNNLDAVTPDILLGGFEIGGGSSDCERVVFTTPFRYPGVSDTGLYASDGGVVEDVAILPDGSPAHSGNSTAPGMGTGVPNATVGSEKDGTASGEFGTLWRAVSSDGSHVYFSADSNGGNAPGTGDDTGNRALYLHVDGEPTVKVSASKTAVVNRRALYQTAATDGSKVAFLANYGLTPTSSIAGPNDANCSPAPSHACALYVYDVATDTLTDVSADANPADTNGAMVAGVIAASDDLSRVYFAARGQLVADKGSTYAANVADGTYNVYLSDDGDVSYVAPVTSDDLTELAGVGGNLIGAFPWAAQSTPDGSTLLFTSTADVTGYRSGGVPQAYLFHADTGAIDCVSCRRDGEPSIGDTRDIPVQIPSLSTYKTRTAMLTDDGQRVVFTMPDALTDDALEGVVNIYEWDAGAVRLLHSGPVDPGNFSHEGAKAPRLLGTTATGGDVFIATSVGLDPHDADGTMDVYDLRVGGGFPEPPEPPASCDALANGCQGGGAGSLRIDTPSTSQLGNDDAVAGERAMLALSPLSRAARRKAARNGALALFVRTSLPGRVSVSLKAKLGRRASRVGRASKQASTPGRVVLRVRLSTAARKHLRVGRSLRVTVDVRQAGARPRSMTVRLPGVQS